MNGRELEDLCKLDVEFRKQIYKLIEKVDLKLDEYHKAIYEGEDSLIKVTTRNSTTIKGLKYGLGVILVVLGYIIWGT